VCGFKCKGGFTGADCLPILQAVPLKDDFWQNWFDGLSGDGKFLVGHLDNVGSTTPAFRWNTATSTITTTTTTGLMTGINGDGSLISGYLHANGAGVRWNASLSPTSLPPIDPANSIFFDDISADGTVLVGSRGGWGLIWVPPATTAQEVQNANFNSLAFASTNQDGRIVVGYGVLAAGGYQAIRWTSSTGVQTLAGTTPSQATDVSRDGTVIVGNTADNTVASRWSGSSFTRATLPALGGNLPNSAAYGTSQNGSVTVGYFNGPELITAAIWRGTTPEALTDVLAAAGGNVAGWDLAQASAVSDDGKVIAGQGNYNGVFRAWIARLP
jgi:uncharacterized membrane protein